MTAIDTRPAVSATDIAAGHFKLGRVLHGIVSNPTLVQPMSWSQNVWDWGVALSGQFYNDHVTLDDRRAEVAAYAAEFGLTVTESTTGSNIRVKAEGTYDGVQLSVWGLVPQDGGAK